jgi:hypothetical protein
MSFQTVLEDVVKGIEWVGEEALALGEGIITFLGIMGPSGMRVATDIATDVAQGTVTPVQAAAQLADVAALAAALQQASQATRPQPPAAPAAAQEAPEAAAVPEAPAAPEPGEPAAVEVQQ